MKRAALALVLTLAGCNKLGQAERAERKADSVIEQSAVDRARIDKIERQLEAHKRYEDAIFNYTSAVRNEASVSAAQQRAAAESDWVNTTQ